MAITRSMVQKDVMVILDHPLVHEQSSGKAFSESSSTELKDKISSAAIMESKGKENRLFLSSEEVCYTYLSTERPDTTDSDWKTSIVAKRSIPEDETYYQIDYMKDVWVSRKVITQLQELVEQIKAVQPKLVIIGGKWSLFFLASLYAEPTTQLATIAGTKNTPKKMQYFGGLNKYRASLLCFNEALKLPDTVLLPIFTPAYQWIIKDKIEIINKDYAKVAQINRFLQSGFTPTQVLTPRRENRVGLTKDECVTYLKELVDVLDVKPTMVVFDVETRHKGIDCEGICYKASESFTIPFTEMYESVLEQDSEVWHVTKYKEEAGYALAGTPVTRYRHYWSLEDEIEIMYWLSKVKLHKNCLHVGQNYLYDAQWYLKQWKMRVTANCDTMILSHVLYNYLQKDLGMLASMYVWDYVAWKDEISSKDNMVRWKYNGKDVCFNFTVAEVLLAKLATENTKLQEFYRFQQDEVCKVVVTMMDRGVAIDTTLKEDMRAQFAEIYQGCIDKLNWVFGEEINLNSTPQVKSAFKDMLGIVPIKDRKTKAESFGAEAMLVYLDRYPEYRSLLTLFLESKSIKVFLRTFLNASLSDDGRMRCSYNPAGTKTYRFSSRKGIDGTGCLPTNKAEALTPDGWVTIDKQPPVIMQYTEQGILEFAEVDWFAKPFSGKLLSYRGRCFKGDFTEEHRIVVQQHRDIAKRSRRLSVRPALAVSQANSLSVPVAGIYTSENEITNISDNWLQRLAMLSADGSQTITPVSNYWRIMVTKERKKVRIWELAPEGIEQKARVDYIRVKIEDDGFTKVFPKWLLELPLRQRQLFIEELSHWDAHRSLRVGRSGDSFIYYTTIPENADLVHTMCHLSDYSASLTIDETNSNEHGNTSTKALYSVSISPKITNKSEAKRWFTTEFTGEVGCPITPSTMWLVRYESEIHITGNTNLANVPSKGKIDLRYSLQDIPDLDDTAEVDDDPNSERLGKIVLPNCKRMFVPDKDMIIADADYSAIDLHFVIYEANCQFLKQILKSGKDVYSVLASHYYQREIVKDDDERQIFKAICHGTNYLGRAPTLAAKAGLSVQRVKQVQDWYLKECYEIGEWHNKIKNDCITKRYTENIFGARFWCMNPNDRDDGMWLNKMVASVPQSSAAILVNKAIVNLENTEKGRIQTLLQVHDSLVVQYHKDDITAPDRILKYMAVEIPYEDVLVIPADLKVSGVSYGDCAKIKKIA